MEQRRLRLGDTLDDYCPRERRVTNHAIVAMIEDDIKQTRCTTCDAEHAYKGARVPRRRKKETPAALFKEVLAGLTDTDATPVLTVPAAMAPPSDSDDPDPIDNSHDDQDQAAEPQHGHAEPAVAARQNENAPAEETGPAGSEDWPMHRPLDPRPAAAHRGAEGRAPSHRLHHSPAGEPQQLPRPWRRAFPRARRRPGPGAGRGWQRQREQRARARVAALRRRRAPGRRRPRPLGAWTRAGGPGRSGGGLPRRGAAPGRREEALALMADLQGKTGLIVGVANKRSIAWAIAQATVRGGRPARHHLPGRAARGKRPRALRGPRRSADPALRRHRRRADRARLRGDRARVRRARLPRARRRVRAARGAVVALRADVARRASAWRSTSAPTR